MALNKSKYDIYETQVKKEMKLLNEYYMYYWYDEEDTNDKYCKCSHCRDKFKSYDEELGFEYDNDFYNKDLRKIIIDSIPGRKRKNAIDEILGETIKPTTIGDIFNGKGN